MRVLLVGGASWAVDQAAHALAGHEVRRCSAPGAAAFPCSRFSGGPCPVDDGVDVAVVVRARPSSEVASAELGAVCALRAGVPLVAAGLAESSPFGHLVSATVPPDGDVAEACTSVAVVDLRGVPVDQA